MDRNHEFNVWIHIRRKRIDLASSLVSRTIVFLDLNFWIRLRDAKLGNSKDKVFLDMLAIAKHLVSTGVCVFPITDSIFHEVRKQSGARLKETLVMIDELSEGVCIHNRSTRVDYEILDFLQQQPLINKVSAQELLWTKPYFLFINELPFDTAFDEDTERRIQQLFADDMWQKGFTDLVDVLSNIEGFTGADFGDSSVKLNESKIIYSDEYSTFHELFMNEIAGTIDTVEDKIIGCSEYLFNNATGKILTENEKETLWNNKELQNGIYNVFRLKKARQFLPYIHILSACHAAIRWDENLKYDGNHQFDFEHAACALPYSDVFFTEKQLKHIITQNQLKLDLLFSCEVIAKSKEALVFLEGLSQRDLNSAD